MAEILTQRGELASAGLALVELAGGLCLELGAYRPPVAAFPDG